MKRLGILTIVLSVALISCNGQNKKTDKKDELAGNMPQTNIKVDKKYDKDGNLVGYDSTYTSYYSNIQQDSVLTDSIFNNFRQVFNDKYDFSSDPFFNDLFFQDSLLKYDFYTEDFFTNRFKNNMLKMDKLFMDMDSIKNQFYNQQLKQQQKLKMQKKTK